MVNMVVRKLVVSARITIPGSEDFVSISPNVGVEVDVEIPISDDTISEDRELDVDDESGVELALRDAYDAVQAKIMQLLVLQALDLEGATNIHAAGGVQALVEEFLVDEDEDENETDG